jgi:hypothetical protein
MDILHGLVRASAMLQRFTERLARAVAESEGRLAADSDRFWNDGDNASLRGISHWRGTGPFQDDDALWLETGRFHFELGQKAAAWSGLEAPMGPVVEWGAGGGMNAVHFAPVCSTFYAVDINAESLTECARQGAEAGCHNIVPIHISAGEPDKVLSAIGEPCGFFLSTYVFEALPTPASGLQILKVAFDLLRPGGLGLVHYRYASMPGSASKGRDYSRNWVRMTTYRNDELWVACEKMGFSPLFLVLAPTQPEFNETDYGYLAFMKPR